MGILMTSNNKECVLSIYAQLEVPHTRTQFYLTPIALVYQTKDPTSYSTFCCNRIVSSPIGLRRRCSSWLAADLSIVGSPAIPPAHIRLHGGRGMRPYSRAQKISELSRSILSFLIALRNFPNGQKLGTMCGVDRSRRASHTSAANI